MALDPSIPGSAIPRFNSPFEVLGQLGQLQQQRQVIRSNQALEEERRQKIEQQRQQDAAQQRLYAILGRPDQTPEKAAEEIRQTVPELYQPYMKALTDQQEKAAQIRNTQASAAKATAEAKQHGLDYLGSLFQLVEHSGHKPEAFNFALNTWASDFPDAKATADQLRQQGGNDPASIKQIVDGFKSTQQQNADTTASTAAADLPGRQADSAMKQQIAAGMQGGLTPDQQVQRQQGAQRIGLEQQRVAIDRQKADQAQSDVTNLTPEGLDAAAMMFAKTGQLPALGMGDKTTRKAIINRAAVMVPGLDVASAKADFDANKTSLATMQKQRDAISAFEQTAAKNIDIFLSTAGKVVDAGSPLANTVARVLSGKVLGSPNQAQYEAARQVAINEVAKITSNPNMAGQLSDAARKEVESFNPQNATLKQTVAVMRLLKRDMANRAGSMDEQISAIKNRIGKATTAPPTGRYNPATGNIE